MNVPMVPVVTSHVIINHTARRSHAPANQSAFAAACQRSDGRTAGRRTGDHFRLVFFRAVLREQMNVRAHGDRHQQRSHERNHQHEYKGQSASHANLQSPFI